jgi:TonB-dependent SusC/RagA subfamily outer membrane receptor
MRTRAFLFVLAAILTVCQAAGQKQVRQVLVTGKVTDTTMAPVRGALIVVDGLGSGVYTRKDGYYSLKIKPGVRTIGAYTTNMGSALAQYDGGSVLNFVLDGKEGLPGFGTSIPDGEKKIQVAYGTVKRKDLTTDVGYIDAQEDAYSSYTNIYDMIQGRVPGVSVTGNKITIRGINSINLSTDPLFVVDGIVVNSIDHISPRQVKSISVLKGSDASLYGSRGAGGVILITLLGSGKQ